MTLCWLSGCGRLWKQAIIQTYRIGSIGHVVPEPNISFFLLSEGLFLLEEINLTPKSIIKFKMIPMSCSGRIDGVRILTLKMLFLH